MDDTERWKAIGERLGQRRKQLRLSKRQAAERAGFSEAQWRVLEAGVRTVAKGVVVPVNPRDDTLYAAAVAVADDPSEIFAMAGRDFEVLKAPHHGSVDLSASGGSLEQLRVADPERFAELEQLAEFYLNRLNVRKDKP